MSRCRSTWLFFCCIAGRLRASFSAESERNNWVVLVETSRYYYNYRHVSNVLVLYQTVKRLGIPDSQIILMLGEDIPCNSRNAQPGMVFGDNPRGENLYGEDVEVDYRGDEVSTENFLRLLTGRHTETTPRNKRLLTDSMSNVFIYITGHSGDEFIKFQDWEELTSNDVADAFQQMHKQRRYRNIFWISDTCQAATLQNQFYTPGILAYGSSGKGQNSYSHHVDTEIGAAVIDRWTYHAMDFLKGLTTSSRQTVQDFIRHFTWNMLHADPELRTDLFDRSPAETRMTDFLASTSTMRFQSVFLQMKASNGSSVGTAATCASGGKLDGGTCTAAGRGESPPESTTRAAGARPAQDDLADAWRLVADTALASVARRRASADFAAHTGKDAVLKHLGSVPPQPPHYPERIWMLAGLGVAAVGALSLV